ncbi:hypothetical protein PpBr36_04086 [Pyricularia pennisetigena]|uniref:hypothetical protein n=1 Tax=Pyricularia pennisetigena TaxID=1578925 RepID=UPI00114DF110|nr:hypothetical protein PpBr36_04086 [Pyricularia pennisetigena]TLS27028.1 hypothetical protein PpBr36_04086 [Pyricularia pennisetigena]
MAITSAQADHDPVKVAAPSSAPSPADSDTEAGRKSSPPPSTNKTPSPPQTSFQVDDKPAIPLPGWKRWLTLFSICVAVFPSNFNNTCIMSAVPEISADLQTDEGVVAAANAGMFGAMALCVFVWMPLGVLLGRRTTVLVANAVVCACSLISALAPNVVVLTAFWLVSGLTTPFILVAGQTILSDIFEPTTRGFATGLILGTSTIAKTIGPLSGALIVTVTSWRVIFGASAFASFTGLVLCFFFVPCAPDHESQKHPSDSHAQLTARRGPLEILLVFNPVAVFRPMKDPRVVLVHLSCGLASFNLYSLLSSIRSSVAPRFNLTTPVSSGLFYLAPGIGFMVGNLVGGPLSDYTVRKWIVKRGGVRLPSDRLRSCLPATLVLAPAGTLAFGWSIQERAGDMALPIVATFFQGIGLMDAFNGLNTYAAEVDPESRNAIISSKYLLQYIFAAAGVGISPVLLQNVGVGFTFTLAAAASIIGGILVAILVVSGGGKGLALPGIGTNSSRTKSASRY